MFENNKFFDEPAQVTYEIVGQIGEYKGIAYGEVVIDIATGQVICIDDDIDIIHVSEDWLPYFID